MEHQRKSNEQIKSELMDLLQQLSDLCDKQKDELIAKKQYYANLENLAPAALEPVPETFIPILMKIQSLLGLLLDKKRGADEIATIMQAFFKDENAFVEKIISNTYFLHEYLLAYFRKTDDSRYFSFTSVTHGLCGTWLNQGENRALEQIPNLQENQPFSLEQQLKTIASEIEKIKSCFESSSDKTIQAILDDITLPQETRIKLAREHIRQKYKELLLELSRACDAHKDELVARAEYYDKIYQHNQDKSKNNYFMDHPMVLDPVPGPLTPLLMDLICITNLILKDVNDTGGNLEKFMETLTQYLPSDLSLIDEIFPNFDYLKSTLKGYMPTTQDNRYQLFIRISDSVERAWASFDKTRLSPSPPVADHKIDLSEKINHITTQIEKFNSTRDKNIKAFLEPGSIPQETKLNQIYHYQKNNTTEELEVYLMKLQNEIMHDVKKNDYYKPFFENKMNFWLDIKHPEIIKTLHNNIDTLKRQQESDFLPRKQGQSSSKINSAIIKYHHVLGVLEALKDSKSSQQDWVENTMNAINKALPELEKSRDALGTRILKALASLLVIPYLYVYNTTGGELAKKHLSALSLFQKNRPLPDTEKTNPNVTQKKPTQ